MLAKSPWDCASPRGPELSLTAPSLRRLSNSKTATRACAAQPRFLQGGGGVYKKAGLEKVLRGNPRNENDSFDLIQSLCRKTDLPNE
jgi:hypothetical protein